MSSTGRVLTKQADDFPSFILHFHHTLSTSLTLQSSHLYICSYKRYRHLQLDFLSIFLIYTSMAQSNPSLKKPWIETPLIESAALSKVAGCRVFLKLELLQPSGSFKSRGIGNLIRTALLDPTNKDKNLHFYSSSGGNAGLAAIVAARDLGCPCTVVVPHSTKPFMIDKLRAAGATDVVQHGASWFEADTFLRQSYIENQDCDDHAEPKQTQKNIYVPPFDHPDVWTGAGTMVSEIAAQLPPRDDNESGGGAFAFPADAIICSVGGGGLFNGIVEGLDTYVRLQPRASSQTPVKPVRVVAAETEGADSLACSLRAGRLQSLQAITSLATSLGALCVSPRTFEYARSSPEGIEVVSFVGSDGDAARGVVRLADETRLQVELACGISVEAAVAAKLETTVPDLRPDSRVVVVVCGGSNVSAEMIAEYRLRLQDGWS
ncbi:tryptophan synthase beta subunit-like PLP-dependent enzyme [Aspergillus taichungensis]|uniref:L-serine ammonia-lyase n=1 Tax=Aspergillus taichungensis TaxID=482145 RepID=A0A2J5HVF1_9EURO|nr:tryptophan synthase beta subunit-like PLP-dependent enzyme [Aspergillus taichungensis]